MKTLIAFFALFAFVSFAVSAEFVVLNTNNTGAGSFRDALALANASPGADVITFNIPGNGPHFIQPTSLLPELADPVTIDGYSQPGAAPATNTTTAILKIVLDGGLTKAWYRALHISANSCVVKGLVICNFGDTAIIIQQCSGNTIEGNYIGLDATGSTPQSNGAFGILLNDASDNLIGGSTPSARNVISANHADGIELGHYGSKRNRVMGNYIGTDATGTVYLPNGVPKGATGLRINDSADNIIGGLAEGEGNLIMGMALTNPGVVNNHIVGNYINTDVTGTKAIMTGSGCGMFILQCSGNIIGPGNVISGCTDAGIYLSSSDPAVPTSNTVIGNYIGTDPTGTKPVPNCMGIFIEGNSSNIIGGAAKGEGNIIAHSRTNTDGYGGSGVVVQTDWNGLVPVGNAIVGNQIYDNDGLGIDLGGNHVVELNDEGDVDEGPNRLMNYPIIERALLTPGRLAVQGVIDTPAQKTVTIDLYANSQADEPTGYGEGETYLGQVTPNKHGRFVATFRPVPAGTFISATATNAGNNTSEFSLSVMVSGAPGLQKSVTTELLPQNYTLEQNYPNPFNPSTTIAYDLPNAGKVRLNVYNALGQQVQVLVDEWQTAGAHSYLFNAQNLPTGVYLYQLQIDEHLSEMRKMVYLK
jgi:parallel beta-helix repeat protein